eukprot:1194536-Prorocentrum_minimum.AAC.7
MAGYHEKGKDSIDTYTLWVRNARESAAFLRLALRSFMAEPMVAASTTIILPRSIQRASALARTHKLNMV